MFNLCHKRVNKKIYEEIDYFYIFKYSSGNKAHSKPAINYIWYNFIDKKLGNYMVNKSIFREYDIRGIVGDDLNEQSVKLIGYNLGLEVVQKTNLPNPTVVIGYDARTHSPTMFNYLTSGFNKAGCKVLGMGMVATGVNYFASFQTI